MKTEATVRMPVLLDGPRPLDALGSAARLLDEERGER
jgi:hypothetical protein